MDFQQIFATFLLANTRTYSIFDLTVEDDSWQPVITHTYHDARPSELRCDEERFDA
jgi:hypothetical protein